MAWYDNIKDSNGQYPAYAWPGGYPIVYFTSDGECMCADCVNGGNDSEARVEDGPMDDPRDGWRVVGGEVYYEGPPETCCHCGQVIESAYGDPADTTDA